MTTLHVHSWDALHANLSDELRDVWYAAVVRAALTAANALTEPPNLTGIINAVLAGTAPPWWPALLPRLRVDWYLTSPGTTPVRRSLTVDPNRSDLGLDSLLRQTTGALVPNPMPFLGTLSAYATLADTPLATHSWTVEVVHPDSTTERDTRALLRQAQALNAQLMQALHHKDKVMLQMFSEASTILEASAEVIASIDPQHVPTEAKSRQASAQDAQQTLLELLRTVFGGPEPGTSHEDTSPSGPPDGYFDAWKAAGIDLPDD